MSNHQLKKAIVGGGQGRPNLQPSDIHGLEEIARLLLIAVLIVSVLGAALYAVLS